MPALGKFKCRFWELPGILFQILLIGSWLYLQVWYIHRYTTGVVSRPVDPRGRGYKHQQSSCAGRDAGQQGAGGREGVGARDAFQESTPSWESGPALAKMKG